MKTIINNNFFILIILAYILFSCKDKIMYKKTYYKDNRIKELIQIDNDSIPNGEYIHYFTNGKIYIRAKYSKGKLSDTIFYYYKNGKIRQKGYLKNGIKYGWWTYYDSITNNRGDSVEYIIRNDSSFVNQLYAYDNNTLNKDESFFYQIIVKDTLYIGNNKITIIINRPLRINCTKNDTCFFIGNKIILKYQLNNKTIKNDSLFSKNDTINFDIKLNNKGKLNLKGLIFVGYKLVNNKKMIHRWNRMQFEKNIIIIDK